MKRRAALLMRTSTDDQCPEDQRKLLLELAARIDAEVVSEYLTYESAWVGKYQQGVEDMLADAAKRKFNTLLIWDVSRLTRKGGNTQSALLNHLGALGVEFMSYRQAYLDTCGPMKHIVLFMLAEFAKWDSDFKSDAVKKAMARLKAEGKVYHRPKGSADNKQRKRRWLVKPKTIYAG